MTLLNLSDQNIREALAAAQPGDTRLNDLLALVAVGNALKNIQVNAGGTTFSAATPPSVLTRVLLPADVTNNNATPDTLADVTGLSFPVTSGITTKFRFWIAYTVAAAGGSRWSINGPALTNLLYRIDWTALTNSKTISEGQFGYNLPAASSGNALTGATANNIAVIEGTITPSASGTVIARFASGVASNAVVAKATVSFVEYQNLN